MRYFSSSSSVFLLVIYPNVEGLDVSRMVIFNSYLLHQKSGVYWKFCLLRLPYWGKRRKLFYISKDPHQVVQKPRRITKLISSGKGEQSKPCNIFWTRHRVIEVCRKTLLMVKGNSSKLASTKFFNHRLHTEV